MKRTANMPAELPVMYRTAEVRRAGDDDPRVFSITFSSDTPYARFFGTEILGHDAGEVRLDWFQSGNAPFLRDHRNSVNDQVGIIESATIHGGRGRATVRFADDPDADRLRARIEQGIVKNCSVGYRVHEMQLVESGDDGDTFRVTDWTPMEASAVALPADQSVGFNRAAPEGARTFPVQLTRNLDMGDNATTTTAAEVAKQIFTMAARYDVDASDNDGDSFNASRLAARYVAEKGNDASVNGFLSEVLNPALARFNTDTEREVERSRAPGYRGRWPGDQPAWSFRRLIGTAALDAGVPVEGFQKEGPERERFERRGDGRFRVPFEAMDEVAAADMATRIITTGTTTPGGGNIVPERFADVSFIDALRARSAILERVVMLTGLDGELVLPRKTATSRATWGVENPADDDGTSDPTFDQLKLAARELYIHSSYSRRQAVTASPEMEQLMRADFLESLTEGLDLAIIAGSGSDGAPTGITNTAGIGSVVGGTNGLAPTWNNVVDLEAALANANADDGDLLYIVNPATRAFFKKTQKNSTTNAAYIWDTATPDRPLNGHRVGVTSQVPANLSKGSGSNLSAILFLNAADVVAGMWGNGMDILVDPYTSRLRRNIAISAFLDADVGLRHAASAAAMLDADV